MASKLIKQGSTRASGIQQIYFADNYQESQPIPEQVHWPELLSAPAAQHINSAPSEPAKPEVDFAMLEKNAYESGYRQGEKAGLAAAEQKIEAIVKRQAEGIIEIGRIKSALYVQVEREVVRLAIEVAKKIVHREVQVDREIIQTLVRVALSHVADKAPVSIHVNPKDFEYISERQTELSQAEGRTISFIPDKSIERGGCLVETDCGDIDARLEEKFSEVEHAFFEGAKT
jgi:flagellar assembly protein FliH